MTGYRRGDVILVNFVFVDESGVKRRPSVVISSDAYNSNRDEAVIAAITSRTDRVLIGDHLISNWREAGLLFPSIATAILRTVKQEMIDRKLGSISSVDMMEIERQLRVVLELQ
jgi:mRNA interferase MazF